MSTTTTDECDACGTRAILNEFQAFPNPVNYEMRTKQLCVFCANTMAGRMIEDEREYTPDQRLMLRTMSQIGHTLIAQISQLLGTK